MAAITQRKLTREQARVVYEKTLRKRALWKRRAALEAEIDVINKELYTLRYKALAKEFDISARTVEAIAQGLHYAEATADIRDKP